MEREHLNEKSYKKFIWSFTLFEKKVAQSENISILRYWLVSWVFGWEFVKKKKSIEDQRKANHGRKITEMDWWQLQWNVMIILSHINTHQEKFTNEEAMNMPYTNDLIS